MATKRRVGLLGPLWFVVGAAALGCEGEVTTAGTGGADAASTSVSAAQGSGGGGGNANVPSVCRSPSGYQVCGGANDCPHDSASCPLCYFPDAELVAQGALAPCDNGAFEDYGSALVSCGECRDGDVCFAYLEEEPPFTFFCAPFELGALLAENGGADRVRYADFSLWTGAPPPTPASCPTLPDVTICGGTCGGCPGDQICTGRSPLHPYGLCIPNPTGFEFCRADEGCADGLGCFVWKVQPEAQDDADEYGKCLPPATCQSAATYLPGGGTCVLP